MKRRINVSLVGLSVAVVLVAAVAFTAVYYPLFSRQVKSDLNETAKVLESTGVFTLQENAFGEDADVGTAFRDTEDEAGEEMFACIKSELNGADLRLTYLDADGTVLFDSAAKEDLLSNHADRPEVIDALTNGEGESVRRSDTLGKSTYYYALCLSDGSVLRLSKEVNSIFHLVFSAIPVILLIVLLIILAAALIANGLTKRLIAPIHAIAENREETSVDVYEELLPFLDTIREQHDNILSAAKEKQDFTANVSHELKTPLAVISGYAQLLENHMADPKQEEEFVSQIHKNADRLIGVIDDSIRLSYLDDTERGRLAFAQVDLFAVADDCLQMLKITAEKKKVSLTLSGDSCMIFADREMIEELMMNLCQNAICYNKEGGKVSLTVKKQDDRPTLVVADTGIGIPKEMQDRVFERFFCVDKSRSRQTGGTGLGLSIVKHIAQLHDAKITLESELGAGTRITVQF